MKAHKIASTKMPRRHQPELHGMRRDGVPLPVHALDGRQPVATAAQRPARSRSLAYAIDRKWLIERVTRRVNFPADSDQPPFFWARQCTSTYPFNAAGATSARPGGLAREERHSLAARRRDEGHDGRFGRLADRRRHQY